MKRFVALLIALVLILTACGGNNSHLNKALDDIKQIDDAMKGKGEFPDLSNITTPEPNKTDDGASIPEDELYIVDGEMVSDPTDEDGNFIPGAIHAVEPVDDTPDYYLNYTYFYTELEPDEMTEERARFRIECDSNRYMDTVLASDSWYKDELNEWIQLGDQWDYARFEGAVDYIEYQDGYTLVIIRILGIDRRVMASIHGHVVFDIGDSITTYGAIALGSYLSGAGQELDCFVMEVMDYVPNQVHLTEGGRSPYRSDLSKSLQLANVGPVDWSQIPQVCYDEWVGPDRVFGTGTGYWYRITPTKANACAYTVEYWTYDPVYNQLCMAISFDDAGEGTYEGNENHYTCIDFVDAHCYIYSPSSLSLDKLTSNYMHEQDMYWTLREAANGMIGTVMYWPDSSKE